MYQKLISIILLLINLYVIKCGGQVIQFGKCPKVQPMPYFDYEPFLGKWYEIERFPTWYTQYGDCAYQQFQYCNGQVEIEHVYLRDNMKFVLHVNSTYKEGDEPIFIVPENTVDPIGIPLIILDTDYINYAIVYGCKSKFEWDLKYLHAWILSRSRTLSAETLLKAYRILTSIPYANVAYLERVIQDQNKCSGYVWTAHIHAQNITEGIENTIGQITQEPYYSKRLAYQTIIN